MMRYAWLLSLALLGSSASAQTINNLGSGTALGGTEQIPMFQGSNPAVTTTANAIKTFAGTTITTGGGASGGTCNPGTTCALSTTVPPVVFTTASPAISAAGSNLGAEIDLTNASADTPTIPGAGTAGYPAGWYVWKVCNKAGAFVKTLTPGSGTIGGAASYALPAGTAAAPSCISFVSDGVSDYKLNDIPASAGVVGPGSSTNGDLASFNGTSGGTIQDSGIPAANVITKAGGGTLASNAVTAMTCPGTAASSVGAVTCVVDYQSFCASGCTSSSLTGNWTKPTGNYTVTVVYGCAAGGSGGSGAVTNSGTVAAGAAGGGAGDCHLDEPWMVFKTADLAGTVAYSVAATTTGPAGKTSTTATGGTIGNQGANTTFGSYTLNGGGGGGAGINSATATTGGAGGSRFSVGANQNITGGCAFGSQNNGGSSGSISASFAIGCSTGGGGGLSSGAASASGSSGTGASGGASGGGITAVPAAISGGAGGLAQGCQVGTVSPAGAAGGATPAVATQDFAYHPGCGGGGGGATIATAPTTAASGAAGGGPGAAGGGGGAVLANASANTSGAGGAGFGGVLIIISY